MKTKLLTNLVGIVLISFILIGCAKEETKESTSTEDIVVTEVITPTEEVTEEKTETKEDVKDEESISTEKETVFIPEDLLNTTKQFALEMTEGTFEHIYSNLTLIAKAQLTESTLKSSYEEVTKPLGEFISIYSTELDIKEDYANVYVVMEYKNNGMILSISYDSDLQIRKINLNYYPIDKEAKNDAAKEIEIHIGTGDILLDGKLTIPVGIENPPVVILVQGSGQSDMDETIGAMSNKPFRDIAFGLAERGIASIRYNKRYYQYPELATSDITIYDEVLEDVDSAITFAKNNTLVNGDRIYIIGHSLGGMLCPKIASMHTELAGFISLAGSPRGLQQIIYDQNMNELNALIEEGKITQEYKDSVVKELDEMMAMIYGIDESSLDTAVFGVTGYYWKSINDIATKKLVQILTLPMLFLQGSADFQVFPEVDFKEWQDLLVGRENATFKLYDNLNHLFMESQGLKDITEYDQVGNVSDEVIDDMALWILEHE